MAWRDWFKGSSPEEDTISDEASDVVINAKLVEIGFGDLTCRTRSRREDPIMDTTAAAAAAMAGHLYCVPQVCAITGDESRLDQFAGRFDLPQGSIRDKELEVYTTRLHVMLGVEDECRKAAIWVRDRPAGSPDR